MARDILKAMPVGMRWADLCRAVQAKAPGTPDVIGTRKPKANDPLKFPIEIIAAELKSDGNASIVAFGQACAYRLFAHRSCVVMPVALSAYDRDRLLTLCGL